MGNSSVTTACVLNQVLPVMEIGNVSMDLMRRIACVWLTSLNAIRLEDVFQSENDVMVRTTVAMAQMRINAVSPQIMLRAFLIFF